MLNNYTPIDDLITKPQPASTGSLSKETEPLFTEPETIKHAVEHEEHEEVSPYIQTRKETIKVPYDLQKIGVTATPTTKFPTYQNIKLPISDTEIFEGLHKPVSSSFRWLAELCVYILKKVHIHLKKVHHHVVRIMKPS